eukprot:COSAG05_NODE_28_length_29121_cov_56.951933_12_plen_126_part_00
MTEIYLHFLLSRYGLYANAPVDSDRAGADSEHGGGRRASRAKAAQSSAVAELQPSMLVVGDDNQAIFQWRSSELASPSSSGAPSAQSQQHHRRHGVLESFALAQQELHFHQQLDQSTVRLKISVI